MPLVSDQERIEGIIQLTAEFRYRICWEGARRLLRDRGIDPMRVVNLSVEQGQDVITSLVLSDGTHLYAEFEEDPITRELVRASDLEPSRYADRYVELAREIVAGDTTEFDRRVQQYFELEWRAKDKPLPPLPKPGV